MGKNRCFECYCKEPRFICACSQLFLCDKDECLKGHKSENHYILKVENIGKSLYANKSVFLAYVREMIQNLKQSKFQESDSEEEQSPTTYTKIKLNLNQEKITQILSGALSPFNSHYVDENNEVLSINFALKRKERTGVKTPNEYSKYSLLAWKSSFIIYGEYKNGKLHREILLYSKTNQIETLYKFPNNTLVAYPLTYQDSLIIITAKDLKNRKIKQEAVYIDLNTFSFKSFDLHQELKNVSACVCKNKLLIMSEKNPGGIETISLDGTLYENCETNVSVSRSSCLVMNQEKLLFFNKDGLYETQNFNTYQFSLIVSFRDINVDEHEYNRKVMPLFTETEMYFFCDSQIMKIKGSKIQFFDYEFEEIKG